MPSAFYNRLQKRYRHLSRYAERWPTEAYRVYDWDIPEYRWAVDVYAGRVLVHAFVSKYMSDEDYGAERDEVLGAVREVIGVSDADIWFQERHAKKATGQYERQSGRGEEFTVSEGPHAFWVNLATYVDTGLFLDHRNLRREVGELCTDWRADHARRPRLLNLFAYTGAFSVWAAAAGAHTTTIDLSNTYLDWAERNFRANDLDPSGHVFERSDVLRYLPQELRRGGTYDVIILDPPTLSRSKKMLRQFEVQQDWVELVHGALKLLSDDGVLYFSTNFQDFEFDRDRVPADHVTEITYRTVPEDFHREVHRCWEIRGG